MQKLLKLFIQEDYGNDHYKVVSKDTETYGQTFDDTSWEQIRLTGGSEVVDHNICDLCKKIGGPTLYTCALCSDFFHEHCLYHRYSQVTTPTSYKNWYCPRI
jgi:hypothetical protein